MDLNHLELPASVIADLYKSSLIETNESLIKPQSTEILTEKEWKFLGGNKKNILIVVNYKDTVHIPDEQLEFLTKMLKACKLGLADVAIVNTNNYLQLSYKEILGYFQTKKVFLFGVEPLRFGLPLNFPFFQVQSFIDRTFLFLPSLEELIKDDLLKSKLWLCLKKIFNLN